jgi:hypothetical protein
MKWILAVLLVFVLIVSGCSSQKNTDIVTANNLNIEKEIGDESSNDPIEWHFQTILNTGKEVICDVDINGSKSTIWIKNDKERIETDIGNDGVIVTLYDGNVIYTWSEGKTQGVILDFNKLDKLPSEDRSDLKNIDEINEMLEGIECKKAKVSDSVFEIPKEIQFMDFADMIISLSEKMSGN